MECVRQGGVCRLVYMHMFVGCLSKRVRLRTHMGSEDRGRSFPKTFLVCHTSMICILG